MSTAGKVLPETIVSVESAEEVQCPKRDSIRAMQRRYRQLRSHVARIVGPKLGVLHQYSPRKLHLGKLADLKIGNSTLPTISIVTPSLDQGQFLRQSLGSVLAQEYPGLEYFALDGGSTDESESILREFGSKLTGWNIASDRGQAHAINLGFQSTTGEIMGWLNSDDMLMPGALTYVGQFFARNPDVSVLYGNRILINSRGLEVGRWILPKHDAEVLRWIDYIPQETLFWRRSLWDAVGGQLDESLDFAIDWDLLLRFQKAGGRFAHVPHFLGAFRIHPQQKTSAQMNLLGALEIAAIRRKHHGYVPSEREVSDRVKWYLYRHILEHARVRIKDGITL
jgi:glycosyltransferase involved in cell wall biosynthesis